MGNPFARLPRDLGKFLFGVWLLLMGLTFAVNLNFTGLPVLFGIILVASGVCFVIGR